MFDADADYIASLRAEVARLRRYLARIHKEHAEEYCDAGPKLRFVINAALRLPQGDDEWYAEYAQHIVDELERS